MTIIGSEFTNNRGSTGGAINSLQRDLTIENSQFVNNSSTAGRFIGGVVSGYGGAVYVDGANASSPNFKPGPIGGTVQISSSLFEGNQAAGQGGGLTLFGFENDKLIIEDSVIINNTVIPDGRGDSFGGGIRPGNGAGLGNGIGPTNPEFTLRNTAVLNNRAEGQGGGLWIGKEALPVTITNSTFSGNRAESQTDSKVLGEPFSFPMIRVHLK